MKIKNRYFLNKKKIKELKKELGFYSDLIDKKSKVELLETYPYNLILIDDEVNVMIMDGKPYPTIKAGLSKEIKDKYVVVDMGAVKFMTNGADVMIPGIVDADKSIEEGDVVFIIEETHKKPLAVGISLISGEEMLEKDKGKAVKTIHYVGDEIWDFKIN